MNLPLGILRYGGEQVPVLLGYDDDGLVGFDPVSSHSYLLEPEDVASVVSIDPVAVFHGVVVAYSSDVHQRAAANKARRRLPRFAARGQNFPLLPTGVLSGFPVAARTIRKHRDEIPSTDTIRISSLFAVSTVRTSIKEAERSFQCFGDLYESRSRTMPPVTEIAGCFRGLQNSKSKMFSDVAEYAGTIRQGIQMGYKDRELRSLLALDSELPNGLGLAKLSFTLALLGHDCICLDARLLGKMFSASDRTHFEKQIGKDEGRVSERALLTYEAAEDAFLLGNKHYDAADPIGRARAQWMSWESVGGRGATHSVWLKLLPETDER